jgi:nucleotide-binding universal stress UspA family protein
MKILLGIDSSKASQVAVEEIARRPWPPGSSAEVVNVVERSHLWTTSETAEEAPRLSRELVAAAVAALTSAGLRATGISPEGDPKRVLLERAAQISADLAVVGSHGVSAVTRYLLGNVAAGVVRYAPCSVEIVRAPREAGSKEFRILLATDGSGHSELAARSLAERPWPAGAQLRILSAVELEASPVLWFEPPLAHSERAESLRADALKRAQDALTAAVGILRGAFPEISESISVLTSSPKTVILDEASQWGAGLIVVGSHGRRGLDRFLMGSVSEAVALHADCSVEVVRKPAV